LADPIDSVQPSDPDESILAVSISDDIDPAICPDHARLDCLARLVFAGEGLSFSSVGIVFANHAAVLELNKEWLGHDWHTDVISFLLEEDPIEGEVYIDVETAQERHAEFEVTVQEELERYAVHGMLHLCGHDDATDEQRDAMRALEDHYLSRLNG